MFISLNKSFGDDYQLKYSQLERAKTIEEIEHPIIREALTRHFFRQESKSSASPISRRVRV